MSELGSEIIAELVELDEAADHDLLGGPKGETISSRCGRALLRAAAGKELPGDPWLILLAGVVELMPWFGRGHCVRNVQPGFAT